jgi:hypothetical protein
VVELNYTFLRRILNEINEHVLTNISIEASQNINIELDNTLKNSLEILQKISLKDTLEFSLWNDIWNQYGIYGNKKLEYRNNSASKSYSRGRILLIDFGHHNIGLEFSLEHMGVVLRDFDGLLEVVPITSDRGQTYTKIIENIIIRVKKDDYQQFKHDSILLVHQIHSIGRNRIVRDTGNSIAHSPLMELLEEKISRTYSPFAIKKLNNEIARLKAENESKNEMIKYLQGLLESEAEVSKKIISTN